MIQPIAWVRIGRQTTARGAEVASVTVGALLFCLACSNAIAGPQPPAGAVPATLEQTLQALAASSRQAPSGIYSLEASFDFNALDAVNYDPATGRISLIGHLDPRFVGRRIPYLQHLAALLEIRDPQQRVHFTLPTPPAELSAVKSKIAQLQHKRDTFLTRFADTFDTRGMVTHLGSAILTSVGLSPVTGHRRPGYFGASVEPLASGAVRVVNLFEGSPADQAGLHAGDDIVRFGGKVPYSAREFERLARFGGAGNKINVTYRRSGQPVEATVTLLPDDVPDLWLQTTRWDVEATLYRVGGKQQQAESAYLLGVLASNMAPPSRLAVLSTLDGGSAAVDQRAEADLARKVVQRLDGVFGLSGNPMLGAYEAEFSSSHRVDRALSAALEAFQAQTPSTVDRLRDFAANNPAGFDIPPSLFDAVFGSHAETKPDYYGEATDTSLARVLLEGDYALKILPHQPGLKERIPGYQTAFEYENSHPDSIPADGTANVYSRVWLSVAKMDVAQSASGSTLVIRDAAMRINTQVQTADGTRDARTKTVHSYTDVLNAHYDELAADYLVLHESREVAKLAAVADWIRKKTPNYRLPKEGRVAWTAPAKVPSIGYMHVQPSGNGSVEITTHVEGGVSLTPYPPDSTALVIPMDRGAPELRDAANVRTPPAAAAALGTDGKSAGGWTTQTTVGGKKATVATIVPPKDGEALRDAVSGVVADKAKADEQERKLRAQMASDQGNSQAQADDAIKLSRILYLKGDDAGAMALVKQAEALQPRSAEPLIWEAQYQKNANDRPAAIATLQKAVALDPNRPQVKDWLNQMQTDQQNGRIPANAAPRPSQSSDGQVGQGGQVAVQMGVPPSQAGLTPQAANAATPTQARQPGASGIGLGSNRALRDAQATLGEQNGSMGQASGCYDGAGPGCPLAAAPLVNVSTPPARTVPGTAPAPVARVSTQRDIQMEMNRINAQPNQTPADKARLDQLTKDFTQAPPDSPSATATTPDPVKPPIVVPSPIKPKPPGDTIMD